MDTRTELDRSISHTPTLLSAVMRARCPQCRQGDFFKGPWNRSNFLAIHDNCPVCGGAFIPEPGFYTGAMYVNYGFNIAQLVVVGLFTWLVINPDSAWWIVGSVLGITFLTIPFTARASRIIWLYMFGELKYDPAAAKG